MNVVFLHDGRFAKLRHGFVDHGHQIDDGGVKVGADLGQTSAVVLIHFAEDGPLNFFALLTVAFSMVTA